VFLVFSSATAVGAENNLKPTTVLVFGDSLSAAFGIDQQKGWVRLLQKRLSSPYFHAKVFNASISGETSQGGLSRIAQVLDKHKPDIVLLELGGNDGLQGLPITLMQDNLERIIQIIQARHIKVLLLGIHLPPNYGKFYTQEFDGVYKKLAQRYKVSFIPFLLEGIATDPDLMQTDGIHPKADAQSMILDNVWPYLKPMLPQRKLR
jgi:acyl-CoA thioesterase-1